VQVKKNLARVKVTINKKGYIPGLGQGPIRNPILITKDHCDQLIRLGYPVKIINIPLKKIIKEEIVAPFTPYLKKEEVKVAKQEVVQETKQEKIEEIVTENTVEVQEEPAVKELVSEDSVIENEEKVVTEEEESILVDDPDLSAGAYYNEAFLTSKALCKKILSNRQIQYEDSASFVLLKKLVSDSNPEVEFVEE